MASTMAASTVVGPVSFAASAASATSSSETTSVRAFGGLKAAVSLFAGKSAGFSSVQNGSRVNCMQVWTPVDNIKFETLSYLPPLTADQIASQIDYMLANKWIPCLEFDLVGRISRTNFQGSGYYDGRYWTMWKLPMFGCSDASMVLREIEECKKAYPGAYIRVLGFDNVRQVQVTGFIAHKP